MGTIEISVVDLLLGLAVGLLIVGSILDKRNYKAEMERKDDEVKAVCRAMQAIAEGEADAVVTSDGFSIIRKEKQDGNN
jgi:hypothetical protein